MNLKEQIIFTGRILWEEGLVTSHGGNISAKSGDKRIIITKSGTKLGFLTASNLVEVPLPSTQREYPEASSELIVHSTVYELTDAACMVHAHPPSAVALSLVMDSIAPKDIEGKLTYKECPVIEVSKPHASPELAQAVAEALKDHKIVCVKGHGTFAKGKNLDEALFYTSALEFSAKVLLKLQAIKALR
ncbi:L-fuculose-phosphate aldolase [Thermosulfidibacter takaii ABI70S6]|uniref:L-fuculose-phosphate aldolase n=1 Tax=Thermosulfidibacter takaii (strain DSM 17441 / JCM 13301 / NBRC 103674 / ABI70S6) TaxID=1298851 RepID=A0A0S3QVW9_THET7|nr:class II aldolase/adducin family protein [Thermosulfidibacter takaii]BAT72465.1 L-fuculose-phosphate aldolase [Thermosulfidibacter takaii ABI70S6]